MACVLLSSGDGEVSRFTLSLCHAGERGEEEVGALLSSDGVGALPLTLSLSPGGERGEDAGVVLLSSGETGAADGSLGVGATGSVTVDLASRDETLPVCGEESVGRAPCTWPASGGVTA